MSNPQEAYYEEEYRRWVEDAVRERFGPDPRDEELDFLRAENRMLSERVALLTEAAAARGAELPHYGYLLRDAGGQVIRVGETENWTRRRAAYRSRKRTSWADEIDWSTVEVRLFPTRAAAKSFEKSEIARLNPRHNVQHRTDRRTAVPS